MKLYEQQITATCNATLVSFRFDYEYEYECDYEICVDTRHIVSSSRTDVIKS